MFQQKTNSKKSLRIIQDGNALVQFVDPNMEETQAWTEYLTLLSRTDKTPLVHLDSSLGETAPSYLLPRDNQKFFTHLSKHGSPSVGLIFDVSQCVLKRDKNTSIYSSQTGFQGMAPIDPSSLEFPQGAREASKRSVHEVHEHCERAGNNAENQNAKGISAKEPLLHHSNPECEFQNCISKRSLIGMFIRSEAVDSHWPVIEEKHHQIQQYLGITLPMFVITSEGTQEYKRSQPLSGPFTKNYKNPFIFVFTDESDSHPMPSILYSFLTADELTTLTMVSRDLWIEMEKEIYWQSKAVVMRGQPHPIISKNDYFLFHDMFIWSMRKEVENYEGYPILRALDTGAFWFQYGNGEICIGAKLDQAAFYESDKITRDESRTGALSNLKRYLMKNKRAASALLQTKDPIFHQAIPESERKKTSKGFFSKLFGAIAGGFIGLVMGTLPTAYFATLAAFRLTCSLFSLGIAHGFGFHQSLLRDICGVALFPPFSILGSMIHGIHQGWNRPFHQLGGLVASTSFLHHTLYNGYRFGEVPIDPWSCREPEYGHEAAMNGEYIYDTHYVVTDGYGEAVVHYPNSRSLLSNLKYDLLEANMAPTVADIADEYEKKNTHMMAPWKRKREKLVMANPHLSLPHRGFFHHHDAPDKRREPAPHRVNQPGVIICG